MSGNCLFGRESARAGGTVQACREKQEELLSLQSPFAFVRGYWRKNDVPPLYEHKSRGTGQTQAAAGIGTRKGQLSLATTTRSMCHGVQLFLTVDIGLRRKKH